LPSTTSWWRGKAGDRIPGIALAVGVFLILFATLDDPGVTWDEAYPNFDAAKRQAEWFRLLFKGEDAFSRETIDQYWFTTSDHPSFPRTCAAFSQLIFGGILDEITAYRLPSAVLFSILIGTVFFWCRRHIGPGAAWVSALCLAMMPRVFGDAHLFSLDAHIMCWWIWVLFTAAAAVEGRCSVWIAGLVYAVAFATKLHAVFLPPVLILWLGLICVKNENRWFFVRRGLMLAGAAAVLTPLVYLGTQPWLWHDTAIRIYERFFDYAQKTTVHPIGLWYFGQRYLNDTPWHYPCVMTLFTVPTGILILIGLGMGTGWRRESAGPINPTLTLPNLGEGSPSRVSARIGGDAEGGEVTPPTGPMLPRRPLILLGALFPLVVVMLPMAQGYDGVRLFLPAFPCFAVLAGYGYQFILNRVNRLKAPRNQKMLLCVLIATGALAPAFLDIIRIHPCQLSYFNFLCGGLPGAQRLGMESTYWCDALTRPFVEEINRIVPPGAKMRPLSMNYAVIGYWQERGVLSPDIVYDCDPPYDFHLLQCRQGMFVGVEWYLYRNAKPLLVQVRDGVPLFMLFGRIPGQNNTQ